MQRVPRDVWTLIFNEIENDDVKAWNGVCKCFRDIGQRWSTDTINKLKAKVGDTITVNKNNGIECCFCNESCHHVPSIIMWGDACICWRCCLDCEDLNKRRMELFAAINFLMMQVTMKGIGYS